MTIVAAESPGWRRQAACRDQDPELFFPIGNSGPGVVLQIENAKAVCRRCEVREICLQWALEVGQEHGVAGGLTENERRSFQRRRIQRTAQSAAAAGVAA
jgi:WhiB family redox-sensing transcriptional regulator